MAQSTQAQTEGVAQVAGRILTAWRTGRSADLRQELEHAWFLAAEAEPSSTLEMERMEALSGAVEALRFGYDKRSGAVRLLEHLAGAGGLTE